MSLRLSSVEVFNQRRNQTSEESHVTVTDAVNVIGGGSLGSMPLLGSITSLDEDTKALKM